MTDADGAVPPELLREIRRLALRTFGEVSDDVLAGGLPVLSRLAAEAPHPPAGVTPLRHLVTVAAERIEAADVRTACKLLFGLTSETRSRAFGFRQDQARLAFDTQPSVSAFRQGERYRKRIDAELAKAIAAPVPAVHRAAAAQAAVPREALTGEALSLLNRTRPAVVWLWGEPGTGKSVLARQLAERVPTAGPAVVIHAEDTRMRHDELLKTLLAHGVDARGWTEPACVDYVRGMLARGELPGVLVLDDVADPYTFDRFVPPEPRGRVVVTSRVRPGDDRVEPLRVTEYTGEEAAEAVRRLLPDVADEQLTRLVTLVGARPIAIDHVCRFVATTPGQSLDTVLDGLTDEIADTLHAVQAAQRVETMLTAVYRGTVAELGPDSDAIALLTAVIWTARSGRLPAALWRPLLARRFPGPAGAVRVAGATTQLADRGIVTVDDDAYVVHALTLGIFRRLLGRGRASALDTYLDVLLETPSDDDGAPVRALIHGELKAAEGLWDRPDGPRQWLLCLDGKTWVWFQRAATATATAATTAATTAAAGPREVRWCEMGASEIWCSRDDGERTALHGPELLEFAEMTRDYWHATATLYRWTPEPSGDVGPHDGLAHIALDEPAQSEPGVVRMKCGKRFRITPGSRARPRSDRPRCAGCDAAWLAAAAAVAADPGRTSRGMLAELRAAAGRGDAAAARHWFQRLADLIEPSLFARTVRDHDDLIDGACLAAKAQEPGAAAELYGRAAAYCARAADDGHLDQVRQRWCDVVYQLARLAAAEPAGEATLADLAATADRLAEAEGPADARVRRLRALVHVVRALYPAASAESLTLATAYLRDLLASEPADESLWRLLTLVADRHIEVAAAQGVDVADLRATAGLAHRRRAALLPEGPARVDALRKSTSALMDRAKAILWTRPDDALAALTDAEENVRWLRGHDPENALYANLEATVVLGQAMCAEARGRTDEVPALLDRSVDGFLDLLGSTPDDPQIRANLGLAARIRARLPDRRDDDAAPTMTA